jgi:ribosomal-protein-alanine N-acetyltransferase
MNSSKFKPFPELTTKRLILRRLSENDRDEIFELRTDQKVNQFLDRPKPETTAEATEFIRKINKGIDEGQAMYWAVCLKNSPRLLGTICLWNFSGDQKRAEIGFELSPAFQGLGLMHEAIKVVIGYAFEKISLTRIDAHTQKENAKSIRILEKNNFVLQAAGPPENIYSLNNYLIDN